MDALYINEDHMRRTGALDDAALPLIWDHVEQALIAVDQGPVSMPLDVFLRSPDPAHFDRIIAKAGLVEEIAGIKWIASAPKNPGRGLPRASGLLILNDPTTGATRAILDAAPVSNLRTAGVALVFARALRRNFRRAVIVGGGVHGNEHCRQLLHARSIGLFPHLDSIHVVDPVAASRERLLAAFPDVTALAGPEDAFGDDTLLLYCTNALEPHVDAEHVRGRRGLTVAHTSLRDFLPEALGAFDHCLVDSIEHVATASTSVDLTIQAGMIRRQDCLSLPRLLLAARNGADAPFCDEDNVILNPMGLVVNDLLVGEAIFQMARAAELGTLLA